MKRLIQLLLILLALQVQAQSVFKNGDTTFYPRQSLDGKTIYRQVGYAVLTPQSSALLSPIVVVHGIGERSDGTVENLRNLVHGFMYGSSRLYPLATADFKTAVRQYNLLGIIPTYKDNLSVSDINFILNDVQKNYNVDTTRRGLIGFSLGGGAVVRYITSSLSNAKRFAWAVAAAPVNWATNWQNVADAQLQFIGITSEGDVVVSPSNIKGMVAALDKLDPAIKPRLYIAPGSGHGGLEEAQSLSSSLLPQSVYDYNLSTSTASRKQYPTSSTPTKPVEPSQPVNVNPAFNITNGQTITTNTFQFDASASTGATDYYWEVTRMQAPWYGYVLQGGAGGGPKKTITGLTDGTYAVRLTVNKNVQSDLRAFTVAIGGTAPVKKLASFENNTITYDDGSTEPGTATLKGGVWVVKNSAGVTVLQ